MLEYDILWVTLSLGSMYYNVMKNSIRYSKKQLPHSYQQQHQGSFNNYVDQILPNFDPSLSLEWTIVDILHDTY